MSTNHEYKIGQKVRSITNGQEYFIVGIKTTDVFFDPKTQLIVHTSPDKPSRFGFPVYPSQVERVA